MDKVVKRQTGEGKLRSLYDADTQSTTYSSGAVGVSSDDDFGDFTDQPITFLPDECIANEHYSFFHDLDEHGYEYIDEFICGFGKYDNCSLHYVRHVETNIVYVAKVVDLHTYKTLQVNIDPCEKAEIADYLTYYSGNNSDTDDDGVIVEGNCGCPFMESVEKHDASKDSYLNQPMIGNNVRDVEPDNIKKQYQDCHSMVANEATLREPRLDMSGKANVVWQYDWFVGEGNRLIMIYENCKGGDLYERILQARQNGMSLFDEPFIRKVFAQVCRGLAYMHSHGFVHGDIKAANVLFKSMDAIDVKIGDYDTCHHFTTFSRNNLGTLMYMAPEIILDSRVTASFESDVWSLGCLLYELLTLSHPFDTPCTLSSMRDVFCNFQQHRGLLLSRVSVRYSTVMHTVLSNIFQFNPKNRPSIAEILSLL